MTTNLDYELFDDVACLIPKTEQDIMATWRGNESKPIVSVICTTFNHVDYVEETIKSFLMQETTFPFEIIINDDASTDGTINIIKNYAHKYPNIIKPIIHKVNKYSQGLDPLSYPLQLAKGKYIALCEGDDFWVNKDKLVKQFNALEEEKGAAVCFHSAWELDEQLNKFELICRYSDIIETIPAKTIITNRGGSIPTASLFFRNENIDLILQSYKDAPIGDFFIQSYLALKGKVIFLPDAMSVYRRNAKGSWTSSQQLKENQISYYKEMIHAIDQFYGQVSHLKNSEYLIEPLIFYIKAYLLYFKQPITLLSAYYTQISFLKHFNRIEVTVLLVKELQRLVFHKTNNIFKYIREKK